MNIFELLWILVDLNYIDDVYDLKNLSQVSTYFYTRLEKSKHLETKKQRILKIVKKWRTMSNWNRINFPPAFNISGSYTEILTSSGAGLFQFHKNPNPESTKMIASIYVKTQSVSNWFGYNPNGYTWSLGSGNRQADSITLDKTYADKWTKLDFFKGGALFPVDLFIENCHVYCNELPFAQIKVVWVHTNAKIKDLKRYNFEWINSQKKWKGVNKNRYLCRD